MQFSWYCGTICCKPSRWMDYLFVRVGWTQVWVFFLDFFETILVTTLVCKCRHCQMPGSSSMQVDYPNMTCKAWWASPEQHWKVWQLVTSRIADSEMRKQNVSHILGRTLGDLPLPSSASNNTECSWSMCMRDFLLRMMFLSTCTHRCNYTQYTDRWNTWGL